MYADNLTFSKLIYFTKSNYFITKYQRVKAFLQPSSEIYDSKLSTHCIQFTIHVT
jgi:hypothetical protein